MKHIILFLLSIIYTINMSAQNKWVEYISGKADKTYIQAKQNAARKWGINYEAAVETGKTKAELLKEKAANEKNNAVYFTGLSEKYGKDWQERFEIAVKKEIPIKTRLKNPIWRESFPPIYPADEEQVRAAIAKEWGISYLATHSGMCGNISSREKRQILDTQRMNENYLKEIAAHYGANWKTYFDKEVQAKIGR